MNTEFKYVLLSTKRFDDCLKREIVWKKLSRLNRETNCFFYSDAQRTPIDWSEKPLRWEWFDIVKSKYNKKKLDNNEYTSTKYIDSIEPMLSDTNFVDMFRIIKGNNKKDLFEYELKNMLSIFKLWNKNKLSLPYVCLDLEGPGKHLKELFGLDVYVVDRMYDNITKEHFRSNYNIDCKYDRNLVFHQITVYGDDKKIITTEENKLNCSVFLWFFKDKIVYKEESGRSCW